MKTKTSIFLAAALLSGCAGGYAGPSYQPTVDVAGSGKDPALYSGDLAACQQLASQTSQISDAAKGAGVGLLAGAGAGAVGGSIKGGGNVAEGAGLGAATGALGGALISGYQSNQNRQNVVMACLRERGWTVVGR